MAVHGHACTYIRVIHLSMLRLNSRDLRFEAATVEHTVPLVRPRIYRPTHHGVSYTQETVKVSSPSSSSAPTPCQKYDTLMHQSKVMIR